MSPDAPYIETGNPFLNFLLNDPRGAAARQAIEGVGRWGLESAAPAMQDAVYGYANSIFAPPQYRALASGGQAGFTSHLAELQAPLQRTADYLGRAARALTSGAKIDPTQVTLDGLRWNWTLDRLDHNVSNPAHTIATGIYDRFLLPGVIQQMQADPSFAPFINELLGNAGSWE